MICAEKISYSTRAEAESHGVQRTLDSWVYKCPSCGFWHLTSHNVRPRWLRGKTYKVAKHIAVRTQAPTPPIMSEFGTKLFAALMQVRRSA